VWVVVVDGVTVGHPCCAVHNCFNPLENQRNHFCMSHEMTKGRVCMIKGCTQLREAQTRVCSDPDHIEAECIYVKCGQARFQLKERLERACVSHPNDSVAKERPLNDVVDDEAEQDIEIAVSIQDDARHASSEWKQLWAQFGCQRMHNEELMVAPCGIILAQQTFYGAEGVSSVAVHHQLCSLCSS
jgi:CxC6 like cysteine cluster associated with KDZ transposases